MVMFLKNLRYQVRIFPVHFNFYLQLNFPFSYISPNFQPAEIDYLVFFPPDLRNIALPSDILLRNTVETSILKVSMVWIHIHRLCYNLSILANSVAPSYGCTCLLKGWTREHNRNIPICVPFISVFLLGHLLVDRFLISIKMFSFWCEIVTQMWYGILRWETRSCREYALRYVTRHFYSG